MNCKRANLDGEVCCRWMLLTIKANMSRIYCTFCDEMNLECGISGVWFLFLALIDLSAQSSLLLMSVVTSTRHIEVRKLQRPSATTTRENCGPVFIFWVNPLLVLKMCFVHDLFTKRWSFTILVRTFWNYYIKWFFCLSFLSRYWIERPFYLKILKFKY